MSNAPCRHEGDQILLVEGLDDCHVILALCNHHKLAETFGIYECGSDDKVLKRLNALILKPDPPKTISLVNVATEEVIST